MAKTESAIDVLVLGQHPAAYLAAALLRNKGNLRVTHARIPDEQPIDRLVLINPALFALHPLLESLRRSLDAVSVYGAQFLSDEPQVRSEYRSKSALALVGTLKSVTDAMEKLAAAQDVNLLTPKTLTIHRLDETGIDVTLGNTALRPKVLVLGGALPSSYQRMLGLPDAWGAEVVHRYTWIRLGGAKWAELGNRPVVPMSLNLKQKLCWGWLLPGPKCLQLCVEQPVETLGVIRPEDLLRSWADVLSQHGILTGRIDGVISTAKSMDLPLAGALAQEGLANRTLLVGPAGGFYSASSEDIYPNCWSAIFAADAIRKAIKEEHMQDALQPYRSKWRTTLGVYLRGPQQNFRFLLPLVYRNQVMTARLAECILLGKSVVR